MNRNKEFYNNRNRSLLVDDFNPRDWGEHRILGIARAVGEPEIRFLKSILDRHGLPVIESAYGVLREWEAEGRVIDSKAKMLNWLIMQRVNKRVGKVTPQ